MTSKSTLPRSRAKTAYGLLSDIARIVTAEPKRLAMRVWRTHEGDFGAVCVQRGYPACGTVGCIGGWTETLTGAINAYDVLDLSPSQGHELFSPANLIYARNQQTAEHARATVAHIRRFQKKYAAKLKAKRIDPR